MPKYRLAGSCGRGRAGRESRHAAPGWRGGNPDSGRVPFRSAVCEFPVQRLAFVIAGANNESFLPGLICSQIIQGDMLVAGGSLTNFRKAALFGEQAEGLARLAARG